MEATSPLVALAAIAVALACTWLLQRRLGAPSASGRFVSIDGLRGYLAFGVFLHHASIWFYYAHGTRWRLPPSTLYAQFGQASVTLFFMVTGFLFCTKLLDSRHRPVDWLQLYVSRLLRLVPLYAFAMAAMLLMVAALTGFELRVPVWVLVKQVVHWLLFTFLQAPDINGLQDTGYLVAGVVWSLQYEWVFYFVLPLLAWPLGRRRPAVPALMLALATVWWGVASWRPPLIMLAPFASGLVAALLARSAQLRELARSKSASLVCLMCLALVLSRYPSSYELAPLTLLTLAFCLIACGNTLFGVLASGVSRLLGDMAYSVYLLHGLLLFGFFRFVLGASQAAELTPIEHWLCVLALVPLLVLACFASLRYIEQPGMRQASKASRWLRARLGLARPED